MSERPYFYCAKCLDRPEEIIEVRNGVREFQKWDGDEEYQTEDTDYDSSYTQAYLCGVCKGTLKNVRAEE